MDSKENDNTLGEGVLYKDPNSPIEMGDRVTIFMGAAMIYRGQVGVVEEIRPRGGQGKNKKEIMYKVKLEGDAFKGVGAVDFEKIQLSHVSKNSLQEKLLDVRDGNNKSPKKRKSKSGSSSSSGSLQMDGSNSDSGGEFWWRI